MNCLEELLCGISLRNKGQLRVTGVAIAIVIEPVSPILQITDRLRLLGIVRVFWHAFTVWPELELLAATKKYEGRRVASKSAISSK